MKQEQLGFIVCLPRTGSTVLADSLGLHSKIYCPPEPHLLYPLFHLGYFKRWYNDEVRPWPAVDALSALVNELPNKTDDYLEALRAYADTIYGKLLERSRKALFIDKTPTYSDNSYLPLIERLYPHARYVVLVRNPAHIAMSMFRIAALWGWGEGSTRVWNVSRRLNEGLVTLARFIEGRPEAMVVRYEDLVAMPERTLERVCAYLGFAFEPAMMERERYVAEYWLGMGDPSSITSRNRLGTAASTQSAESRGMSRVFESQLLNALGAIDPRTCEVLGYSSEELQDIANRHRHGESLHSQRLP